MVKRGEGVKANQLQGPSKLSPKQSRPRHLDDGACSNTDRSFLFRDDRLNFEVYGYNLDAGVS